jgi:Fe-S-cluster containining protein
MTSPEGYQVFGCEIYDNRPDICRINKSVPNHMTTKEYFRISAIVCNQLQKEQNIDERFRLSILSRREAD